MPASKAGAGPQLREFRPFCRALPDTYDRRARFHQSGIRSVTSGQQRRLPGDRAMAFTSSTCPRHDLAGRAVAASSRTIRSHTDSDADVSCRAQALGAFTACDPQHPPGLKIEGSTVPSGLRQEQRLPGRGQPDNRPSRWCLPNHSPDKVRRGLRPSGPPGRPWPVREGCVWLCLVVETGLMLRCGMKGTL